VDGREDSKRIGRGYLSRGEERKEGSQQASTTVMNDDVQFGDFAGTVQRVHCVGVMVWCGVVCGVVVVWWWCVV
jgi:hypothetical protein